MPDRLHFTGNDEADTLIANDPMALLIGFSLDQQVPVPKAFIGPLVLRERLGADGLEFEPPLAHAYPFETPEAAPVVRAVPRIPFAASR